MTYGKRAPLLEFKNANKLIQHRHDLSIKEFSRENGDTTIDYNYAICIDGMYYETTLDQIGALSADWAMLVDSYPELRESKSE